MDTLQYLALLVSILLIVYHHIRQKKVQHKNLPPSPPSLPIIGHFHLLKKPMYKVLNNLSNKYGPILLLRLGSRPALVISSRAAIEECLTKNDVIFANRPILPSKKIAKYNYASLSAPYGDLWRNLRRVYALEFLSSKRLQLSANIRSEEIRIMVKHLFKSSLKGVQKVDVKSLLFMAGYNIIVKIVAGKRIFEEEEMDTDMGKGKMDDLNQTFSPPLTMALGDYFPYLRWLTFYGAEKKLLQLHRKRDAFLYSLIDEHRNTNSSSVTGGEIGRTMIGVMLKLQESEPEVYTDDVIKGMMQGMLIAGLHTMVMTEIFVVSRLTSHPDVLKIARDEIDNHVGQSRLINDADLDKLPYLHCIINETLRLDPILTVLPAHESSKECTVGGYCIPGGTQLLVNVWALHRDPDLWTEPYKFKPERFLQNEEEKGGCKFIPFGSGRRQCPGEGLAMRLVALSLGTLIQCFEWEKAEERPLNTIFRPRDALIKVLAQL